MLGDLEAQGRRQSTEVGAQSSVSEAFSFDEISEKSFHHYKSRPVRRKWKSVEEKRAYHKTLLKDYAQFLLILLCILAVALVISFLLEKALKTEETADPETNSNAFVGNRTS